MRSVRLLQPQAELPPCGLRLVYRRSSGPVWGYLFPSTGQRRGFQYSSSRNDAPFWPYTSNKAPPQVAWWCMPAVDAPPCIFNNPLAAAPPMADCAYNWDFSLPLSAIGGESQCGHVQSPLFVSLPLPRSGRSMGGRGPTATKPCACGTRWRARKKRPTGWPSNRRHVVSIIRKAFASKLPALWPTKEIASV